MKQMTKRERLEATIAGEAVDRPAIALWRHWPGDDQFTDELTWATLAFQKMFDFDFIKISPASNYCVIGYGQTSTWQSNDEGTRIWGTRVIQQPEDWLKLKPLKPQEGLMGKVVRAIYAIGKEAGTTPFIPTIFNPLAQAKNLAGDNLLPHLRQYPDAVKAGLNTITESTLQFIEAIKESGIAGIFLAIQHARYTHLSEVEYQTFGAINDQRILDVVSNLWLNVLHLHGNEVMFDLVAKYPAAVLNWHDQETYPSLAQGKQKFPNAVCGGLRQWETMVRGTPDSVKGEVYKAIEAVQGKGLIVGTGCVTPVTAPIGNIKAAREAVENTRGI